jgi:hypothetical protein
MEGREMNNGVITNAHDWRSKRLQGKLMFQGLPISIETERGSYRMGKDEHGNSWRTFMHIPYGYVRATEGVDGDHVDVYVGPDKHSSNVFIVHQVDPYTGKYDEDKCMLGFNRAEDAKAAYIRQYDRPDYFGTMDEVDMATFKTMLKERKGMKLKKSKDDMEKQGVWKKGDPLPADEAAIKKGTKVEMEHTDDPEIARQIALDHLAEDPKYYDKLEKMEKAKYIRRYKDKNGKWQYVYKETKKKSGPPWIPEKAIDPAVFNAAMFNKLADEKGVSVESVLKRVAEKNPEVYRKIADTEEKLKKVVPTTKKYRKYGESCASVYEEERAARHHEIIQSILTPENIRAATPESGKPVLRMLGGRGGSGKSWFKGNKYDPSKAIVIDADEVKESLEEYHGWNAFEVHEESADIVDKLVETCRNLGLNIVIDATLKTPSSAVERAKVFAKNGYDIAVNYMHVPRQIAAERAVGRFVNSPNGRYVPVDIVLKNTDNEKSFEQLKQYAKEWSFHDNSGTPPPKLISQSKPQSQKELFKAKSEESTGEVDHEFSKDFYDFRGGGTEHSEQFHEWLVEFMESMKLEKAKYIRKYFKNGKWNYEYPKSKTGATKPAGSYETIAHLGGSTGAVHARMEDGSERVLKRAAHSGQLMDEYTANRLYKVMGIAAPSVELIEDENGKMQSAPYIQGTPYADLNAEEKELARKDIQRGFVADALLGNWDVIGLADDNILWDGKKAWRIDNGGSLRYRAQGGPKGEAFGPEVTELETMRSKGRSASRVFGDLEDSQIQAQIEGIVAKRDALLSSIEDAELRRTMEQRINYLSAQLQKSKFPAMSLIKSDSGQWYLHKGLGKLEKFFWFKLEKAESQAKYYSPDEVKARGMRWVTIRGAHVLLQGTSDGNWVVVGGAGGKLNHLKVEGVMSKEDYAKKRKEIQEKGKEETKNLSKEDIAEARAQRKAQVEARKEAKAAYTEKITEVLGMTPEEFRSQIKANEMTEIEDRAKKMVEKRKQRKTMDDDALNAEIERQTEVEVKKAVQKKVKNVERQALETLMSDYAPSDPNAKPDMAQLLDKDKAMEILAARKQFRKQIKEIGKGQADIPTDLKVGSVFAGASDKDIEDIQKEVAQNIETQKNIELYDTLNAQSLSINSHVDQGSISALNGLLGDVYGVGAVFNTDTVKALGLEAVARAVTIKLQQDGKGEIVRKALEEYTEKERLKTVESALNETKRRMANADALRDLARDKDDAEAILSMASANGHALKQITAAQRALGTAVGSLRAAAHMINALEDPPADVVQIDMGKDLARARRRAKEAGLQRGTYSIKTVKKGRAKRLVMEIPKESLNNFFQNNIESTEKGDKITQIKRHEMNDGYTPPGIRDNIKLDAAQEAGVRFFAETGKILWDYEAGLGKTATAYSAAMEAMSNKGAKKILIVTPSSTRDDFYRQRKKFLNDDMHKVVRSPAGKKDRRHAQHMSESGINIISHDALREDASMLKSAGYDMVIVDEIHEMTAGQGNSGRFKGLMELADVPLKVGMSGTNIIHDKKELYRKINFIDPDHTLGTMAEFEKKYKGLNQGTGIFADAANDAFRKEVGKWVYTQKNKLPIKNNTETIRVPLTPEQRKRYAESERKYKSERDKKRPGASARRDSRNYSIVSNGLSEHNAKAAEITSIMKSKHENDKAVIHASKSGGRVKDALKTTAAKLRQEFGPDSVRIIDGDTSRADIRRFKEEFNDANSSVKFLLGTKSLESGHNLQHGGRVTFHLDIPDSKAALDQRTARVFRKGQQQDTSTYIMSGVNPYDMRSEDLLDRKAKEMGILGNPREVESMDDTGFIGMLNKYESEMRGGKSA